MDHDLDDTHLCIKCNQTIVGLDNYIQHRKQNCSITTRSGHSQVSKISPLTTAAAPEQPTEVTPAITYEPFHFNEPEATNPASHGAKTSKALGDSYELPYELEADVFFSSLQLQSVQSSVGQNVPVASGGKTGSSQQTAPLTRQKSLQQEETWFKAATSHQGSGEHFLKDVSDLEETKKSYDTIFKTVTFKHHESPEVSEEEEEDDIDEDIEDDDEDYDPMTEVHGSGGKWKLSLMRHSPPVVPMSHTGGKWKPEHRPNLRVAHSQLSRVSPTWDDNLDDMDAQEGQHPPSDHTKGKWIPGTKLQRLEYKEVVELAKCSNTNQDYWCNICCRKLKSKIIYENHLKTSYHLKRAEPELQLEKATIKELSRDDINKSFSVMEFKPLSVTISMSNKKRKRRSTYLKCSLCKHVMFRHLIGKHLISHYHYRRMQLYPAGISLAMILDNIHAIVLQSPFQCRSCRFYANTEETFLLHWNSVSHLDASEGPGRFWCSYCQFECEDNNQMRRHLLGPEHKEVLLAINRSVPVCISKRLSIECPKCFVSFRFNFELKRHMLNFHRGMELMSTASDAYQSKFRCISCPEILPSKIALQRHEKFKHFISKYFCSICNLEFNSPCQARRHRKTLEHKQNAVNINKKSIKKEVKVLNIIERPPIKEEILIDDQPSTSEQAKRQTFPPTPESFKCKECLFTTLSREELKLHEQKEHINSQHNCILCSNNFSNAQQLGRHTRKCKLTTIATPEEVKLPTQLHEIMTHQGEKIWLCELCDFKTPFRSEILYHRVFHSYASVAKNQLLPCPLCDRTFRKRSLRFHLHIHTKEKLLNCDICGSSFSRPTSLKSHVKNIHGEVNKKVPFPCNSCDKVFKSKHSMKMHHLKHHVSESTPAEDRHLYKCTQENCNYASVSKSLLTVHLTSHSTKSFKCSEKNCNYVGKSKLHLKRHHQSSHIPTEEAKYFACKQCKFKTKTKSHLKRHMRLHTGEKPYPCPHCDFRSTSWENLRKHILKTEKHPGKFVFECQKCKENFDKSKGQQEEDREVFKTNSHLEYQQHLKSQHKEKK